MATAARRKRRATPLSTREANSSSSTSEPPAPVASATTDAAVVVTVLTVASSTDPPHARDVTTVTSASTNNSSSTSLPVRQHTDSAASLSAAATAARTLRLLTGSAATIDSSSSSSMRTAPDHSSDSTMARASTKRLRVESEPQRRPSSSSSPRMQRVGDHDDLSSEPSSSAPGDAHAQTDPDAPSHDDILARIAALGAKNLQLSADIELLKRSFVLRQAETNQLLVGINALDNVEHDMSDLQREYRACVRNNVALIQDALRRIAYCAAQVNALSAGESVTASQLENVWTECSREMDGLLLKLEDVDAEQQGQQVRADVQSVSALDEIQRNRDEIEQLKHELESFRQESSLALDTGQVPVSTYATRNVHMASVSDEGSDRGPEHALVVRIERFSSQLEDMRNEMAMLKQFLLQESSASRSGVERVLARHLRDFQDAQDDESKRLQDEMDELRSELCDVLKEMHLLKERTRYLRPDCAKRPTTQRRRREQQLGHASDNAGANPSGLTPSPPTHDLCSTCSSFLSSGYAPRHTVDNRAQSAPVNQQRTRCSRSHCGHPHQCQYHYPIPSDAVRMDQRDYTYAHGTSSPSQQQQRPSPASSRSSSPRRPSDAVLQVLQQHNASAAQQQQTTTTQLPLGAQSCPSPHFSSRSSSISGRLSVNRDENGEPLRGEEVERRLLEQHRLFWIKEGAGEPK